MYAMFDHSPINDFPGWPATTWFTSPVVASTRYCWAWSIATTAAAPSTAWRPSRWRTWSFSRAAWAFERWDTTRWGPGNWWISHDFTDFTLLNKFNEYPWNLRILLDKSMMLPTRLVIFWDIHGMYNQPGPNNVGHLGGWKPRETEASNMVIEWNT